MKIRDNFRHPYFNPRPRKEGDVSAKFNAKRNVISIHALVKRATSRGQNVYKCIPDFNPRPRKEGDERYSYLQQLQVNFNPRPRKEGDCGV